MRGFVTYDEILKAFPTIESDVMFLEELYDKFQTARIDVLEGGGMLEITEEEPIKGYSRSDSQYDSIQMYLREIGKYPLLNGEQERSLAKRITEGDGEATVETVEKSLQEMDAGAGRFALLSKGFMAQMSMDPASKAKADAECRMNETGQTPHKGAMGMAPGAMSKEQIDEFAEALKAQGYVLAKAEAPPVVAPVVADPPADEIERVAKLLANEGLVKAALGKLDGATREALNKALGPQSAQPPADAGAEDPFAALKASPRSDADFYAQFLRSKQPQ